MRLSDAIALGRVLITKPDPFSFCGCAIGMGIAAVCGEPAKMNVEALEFALKEWPWLGSKCEAEGGWSYEVYISNKFARVCEGMMTLDELIDWVRSIEPQEQVAETAQQEVTHVFQLR